MSTSASTSLLMLLDCDLNSSAATALVTALKVYKTHHNLISMRSLHELIV